MFFKKINILMLLMVLSACSAQNINNQIVETTIKDNYGIWQQKNCQLEAKRANVTVKLTDVYVENKIRVAVVFDIKLVDTPKFKIYGLEDYDFNVSGFGNSYALEVPTELIDQARMHLNQAFLEVTYLPEDRELPLKAYFSLQKFPEAMLDIKKYCI